MFVHSALRLILQHSRVLVTCLAGRPDSFGERNMKLIGVALILLMLNWQWVWAVTTFKFETKELDSDVPRLETMTLTADVDKRRLRVDSGTDTSIVYRDDLPEKVVLVMDHANRSTQKINRQWVKGMSHQMSQMVQKLQARLQDLPPEVQKRFQQMQNQRLLKMDQFPARPPAQIKYTKKRGSVGLYECTWYEVIRGTGVTKICATAWDKVKYSRATFELFQEMIEFKRDMIFSFMAEMPGHSPDSDQMNMVLEINMKQGFPVQMDTYKRGKLVRSAQLKSVKKTSPGNAFFDSPTDYEILVMGRGRMRHRER